MHSRYDTHRARTHTHDTTGTDKLYFVMDYVSRGELFFHLQKEKTFAPKHLQFHSAKIIVGLEYLHNQGVIYRYALPNAYAVCVCVCVCHAVCVCAHAIGLVWADERADDKRGLGL